MQLPIGSGGIESLIRQVVNCRLKGTGKFWLLNHAEMRLHARCQWAAGVWVWGNFCDSIAAATQGQFWSMHDTLFAHQQKLENGYLVEYANDLGLDIPQFLKELSKQVHVDRVNEDIESGLHSGITAAPALFIDNIRYTGRWKITELTAAIVAASH